jgi:hypothetical protein
MLVPPPLPAPPPPEHEEKLTLGIEKSDQKTENWLGMEKPTEHLAKLSEVTQPQLDPNPGTPGTPGMGIPHPPVADPALAPAAQPPSVVPPAPPQVATPQPPSASTPTPSLTEQPKQDPVKAREGDANGKSETGDTKPPRAGEPMGTGEKTTTPPTGVDEPRKADLPLPGIPEKIKGIEQPKDKPVDVSDKHEMIKAIEPAKAVRPVEPVPEPSHAVAVPEAAAPSHATTPTATAKASGPAAGANVPGEAAGGGGGDHPGTKSEKEADASSTTASIEIRPGHPAAAQGLDITTKRPHFTRLTRVVSYPERNPLFKVTFNARGVVTKVKLMESSGVRDVDEPVINAIYQWTAKGKALQELASGDPASGLTISVRILLR